MKKWIVNWLKDELIEQLDIDDIVRDLIAQNLQAHVDIYHPPAPPPAEETWKEEHVERYGLPHPSLEGAGFVKWEIIWLPDEDTKWLVATGHTNDEGGLMLGGVPEHWMDPLEVGQTFWGFDVGLQAGSGSNGGPVKVLLGDIDYPYYYLRDTGPEGGHNTLEKVEDE